MLQFLLLSVVSTVLSTTKSETQAAYRQEQYTALEPGETGPGSTIAVHEEISVITCSFQCSINTKCEGFQYKTTEAQRCTLVQISPREDRRENFTSSENNLMYAKNLHTSPGGIGPVFYFNFDSLDNIILREDDKDAANDATFVDGKVNKALKTDRARSQWIDLGDLSEACITRPDACGPEGAAVSFWLNLIECKEGDGVISTTNTGLVVDCLDVEIRYSLTLTDGQFKVTMDGNPSGWTHIVVNYLGPDNGQGIRIYYDGQFQKNSDTKETSEPQPGNGLTAVGRRYYNMHEGYASLEIDELAFFNMKLSDDQIMELFDAGK